MSVTLTLTLGIANDIFFRLTGKKLLVSEFTFPCSLFRLSVFHVFPDNYTSFLHEVSVFLLGYLFCWDIVKMLFIKH